MCVLESSHFLSLKASEN